ncbi:extracellular solute-binding protein [Roseomonas sp. JC162]|uniref:Extracellular solute-binding protein n=1 Tax=Neoroseomonas marina TaxID=1232220 RepID=A0A848EDM6_9PROT|nr:extracellular solute-binding protein [Neoroseomonas marina]NMJ41550.1 extracellular solute-binding protein [Neoroseomonas marina]
MTTIRRRSVLSLPVAGAFAADTLARPAFAQGARPSGQGAPANYPTGYDEIVAAAQREGSLLIYSVMSPENWRPVIQGYNARYPGIRVETLDLPNTRDVFERYLAERGTNARTGDLLATPDPAGWLQLQARSEILDYKSPEDAAWPAWAKPIPGVYTCSADPLVFIYNKMLVPDAQAPKTFAQFVERALANRGPWRSKITSYGAHNSGLGYSGNYAFVRQHGDQAWNWFRQLAELQPRWERSGGPMTEKVTAGEYVMGWFVSAITFWPRLNDAARARVLGWNFIGDGQPVVVRGVGVPKGSRNVNAAKLMLDYIASAEGQQAFGRGGLTPARPDVRPGDGIRHTFSSISEAIGGEQNMAFISYDPKMVTDYDSFLERWRTAYGVR